MFEKPPSLPKGRMNADQRLRYLIGAAVVRQIDHGDKDPDTRRAMAEVINWLEHWLSQEDLEFLESQGLIIDVGPADELRMRADRIRQQDALRGPPDPDDPIPF